MSERTKGATSVSLLFRLTDVTTGAPKTALDVTTLKLQYGRPGAAPGTATSLSLLAAPTTAWTSYGAKEVDATNSPGVYRVDAPDLAFAAGADEVTLTVNSAAIQPSTRLVDLTNVDMRDGVRGGLTALPNVASGSAGAVVTSGTGTAQLSVSSGLVTLAGVTHTGAVIPTVATVTNQLTANAVADAVLSRDVSNVEGGAPEHSLCTIVLATTEWSISGATWNILRTNGVTTHASKTLTTAAGADGVTSVG